MSFKNEVGINAGTKHVSDEQAAQLGLSTERTGVVTGSNGARKKYVCKVKHFADLPKVEVEADEAAK